METERGLARWQVGHFKILPAHAPPPAGADGLHARLLGRESSGKALVAVGLALDIGDLGRRINALDEAPAMALDGRANPRDFGQIHSRAYNHVKNQLIVRRAPRRSRRRLGLTRGHSLTMLGPAFLLRGGDALARGSVQHALLRR